MIKEILMNPVYTGAIASQKTEYRFKIGNIRDKKPEDWIVVEGTHEPLVDKKSFAIVQEKLKSRQRPGKSGEINLFAGPIKCGKCGKALTIRTTHEKFPKRIFSCKTCRYPPGCGCVRKESSLQPFLLSAVFRLIDTCARTKHSRGKRALQ